MRPPLTLAVAALLLATAGCSVGGEDAGGAGTSTPDGTGGGEAAVPDGWTQHEATGFSLLLPPEWEPRPEDLREDRAAMDVGVPFTGQPYPPPRMLAFVETEPVGPLDVREDILRTQLEWGLPEDVEFEQSTQVVVDGAVDARELAYTYTSGAATSVLGTDLEETPVRQVDLLVETPDLPKLGFRFSAPAEQFDAEEWETIRDSIQVRPEELREQPDPAATTQDT